MKNILKEIDLRGIPCPANYIRCRLALEELAPNDSMQIKLDTGEPELMVISSLREDGHIVEVIYKKDNSIKLLVTSGAS